MTEESTEYCRDSEAESSLRVFAPISRRNFLKQTAITGAAMAGGLATASCSSSPSSGSSTLNFWVISPFTTISKPPLLQAISQYQQENRHVKIVLNSVSADNMLDKIIAAVRAGQGPDVASVDSAWIAELAAAKVLKDISGEFASVKSEFFPGPVEAAAHHGAQYAVPWYTNNVALFWNKRMFREVGISGPPGTWSELVTTGNKLTRNGKYGFMMGSGGNGAFLWLPFLWQAGGNVLSPDGKTVAFGGPAGLKAWEFYASLPLNYHMVPPAYLAAGTTWESYFTPFMNEQAAMMTIGDWAIAPMKQGNPSLDYGIAPLPSDVQRATVMGGYTLGVTTTSHQPSAAWDFIQWLTAKPQEWILEGYSRIPARQDVAGTTFGHMPLEQGFLEQAGYGRPQPNIPQWYTIATTSMSNAWDATIRRVVSPEQGLKQAVAAANKVLANAVTIADTWVESGSLGLARMGNCSKEEGGQGRERLVTRTEPANLPPNHAVRDA